MRCIFCKSRSNSFKSVEHIIPESLGNTKTVLPHGIVCDKCNNYFARKVEGKLLNSDYFKNVRFRNVIPSKKGRIPVIEPVLGPNSSLLGMSTTADGEFELYPLDEKSDKLFSDHLSSNKSFKVLHPIPAVYDKKLMSRLLAKIAIELLTSRVMSVPGWQEEVVFKSELDPFRKYARHGSRAFEWQFYERRIYPESLPRKGEDGLLYETLNEMDLLYIDERYLLAVICLFGVEYTIDMVNPEVSMYEDWLEEHNYVSPLYCK